MSSESDDALYYQDLPNKILKLRARRYEMPWVGDSMSPEDTQRMFHALTSASLAFAKYANLSGDKLVALLELAMDAQQYLPASEGIDEGTVAILEALGER